MTESPAPGTSMRLVWRSAWLVVFLLAVPALAAAQDAITGRVVRAEDGAPLAGVAVQVKGGAAMVVTGEEGRYMLRVPPGASTLVFSLLGYATQEVAIEGRSTVDVVLAPSAVDLGGLVVVGYTTQQRREVSGAVSSVSADALDERKVATLEEALRGRLAGVSVVSSGAPGQSSQVVVRGQRFLSNPSPLYVVDGLYMAQNPNLNPEDIESIDVLKDASAAAQYGAQAANGVIVIRTKRGGAGSQRISISSYYGFQDVPKRLDLAGTAEWAALTRQAYENAGLAVIEGALNPPSVDTDWQDALFQSGAIQDHNLAVEGGSEAASYRISGGYLNQEGTIIGTGFERYSLRVNSEVTRGRLTVGEQISLSRSERENMVGFPLVDAVRMPPSLGVYDEDNVGGWGYGNAAIPTFGVNPVGAQVAEDNRDVAHQVFGTLFAEVRILDNLRYRLNLGATYEDLNWLDFIERAQLRQNNPLLPARLTDRRDNFSSLLFENLVTYEDAFGPHEIQLVGGYTEQESEFQRLEAFRRDYADPDLREIDAGSSDLDNAGFAVPSALRSFLARANYTLLDRYLVTASFRRDGSSRFGPDNRWGTFGSGSLGWILSDEAFYENVPLLGRTLPYLKLRASYGVLGNQDIGDFAFSGLISSNLSYPFADDQIAVGAIQLNLSNPEIRWQENRMLNIGADAELLEGRLGLSLEYYRSESDGLLVQAPLPPSLGSASSPYVNAGSVRNTGFELSGTHRLERGPFKLRTVVNLTTVDNEVVALGNNEQPIFAGPGGVARTTVGGPIGAFYVLETDGIFQSLDEVVAHGAQPSAQPGDVRFVDRNGDGLINDEDRYVAGSAVPDLEGGLFLDGSYNRFDFGLGLRGSYGAEIFNVVRWWTDRGDDPNNFRRGYSPWTPDNPTTDTPRLVFGAAGAMNSTLVSDRWLDDGSYLRIQNVVLGYRVPGSVARSLGLGELGPRIYLNLQNLHTFTSYPNWDVEAAGSGFNNAADAALYPGFDDGAIYPIPRTVTIGIDFDF